MAAALPSSSSFRRFHRRSPIYAKLIVFLAAVVLFSVIIYYYDVVSLPAYFVPSVGLRNPQTKNTSSSATDSTKDSDIPYKIINGTDDDDIARVPVPIFAPDFEEMLEGSDVMKKIGKDEDEDVNEDVNEDENVNVNEDENEGEDENENDDENEDMDDNKDMDMDENEDTNNIENDNPSQVEQTGKLTLPDPLPLPYMLRDQFTDAQLASLVPENCPAPPWTRNLTAQPILIVGHQTSFGFSKKGTLLEKCPWPCVFTNDISRVAEADAHFYSMLHFHPGGFPVQYEGEENERKCPLQRFVFWSMESQANYPETKHLDAAGFDISMTYRIDSDVPSVYFNNYEYDLMKQPLPFETKNESTAIATAFISNCFPINDRKKWLLELMKLLPINSYGACEHNADAGNYKKGQVIRKFLFTLAFENSNSHDYVTEKMYQALEAGTVPVFIGTSNVQDFVPQNSIINVADYKTPRELAKYLLYLRDHPRKYAKYLAWKKEGIRGPFAKMLSKTNLTDRCRLCGVVAGENVGW